MEWDSYSRVPATQHWSSALCRTLGWLAMMGSVIHGFAWGVVADRSEVWLAADTFVAIAAVLSTVMAGLLLVVFAVALDCVVYCARAAHEARPEAEPAAEHAQPEVAR